MCKEVRFGVVGCGNIGAFHVDAIRSLPNANLIGVSDADLQRGAAFAMQKQCGFHHQLRDLLNEPGLDAVCICTPSGNHLDVALACIEAGKHVLCEKPLEINTRRIDQMIDAAAAKGVLLGGVFQNRLTDTMGYVRDALAAGRFGRLLLGNAYIKWYRDDDYYGQSGWRGTRKLDGGGALMNQGIHQIDLLLWLMGKVKRVCGQVANLGHVGLMETEDIATVMLEFENGAFGTIEASTALWPGLSADVAIHGTDGHVLVSNGGILRWEFRPEQQMDENMRALYDERDAFGSAANDPTATLKIEGHRRVLKNFVDAIQQGSKFECDGYECRKAVALIEQIYVSAEKHCWVDMED